jgi:hypothetical protein
MRDHIAGVMLIAVPIAAGLLLCLLLGIVR